jgi:hypothetical protein
MTGDPTPGIADGVVAHVSDVELNDLDTVAFETSFDLPDGSRSVALWISDLSGVSLVAQRGDVVPDTGERTFLGFGYVALNNLGDLAFYCSLNLIETSGTIDPDNEAICAVRNGNLMLVAREGDPAPGAPGEVFGRLVSTGSAQNQAGELAFVARLGPTTDVNFGLWVGPPDDLRLLLRSGDSLLVAPGDLRTVVLLSIVGDDSGNPPDGQRRSFNDHGQVAFWSRFDDGSEGIFVATPKELVLGVDLVVTDVNGPPEGNIGETIDIATTDVLNQGTEAAGATEVGFYFTTDPINEPNQTFSGSVCPITALDGGSDYICQDIAVNVPGSLAAGSYSLVAIVDDQDNVAETDETNNDLADLQPILLSCKGSGDGCTGDAQCCSKKCRGGRNMTCKGDAACNVTEPTEVSCTDGLDNDCDGNIDSNDSDCPGSCTPTENPEVSCSDGQDNDCDGDIDLDDTDCQGSCFPKGDSCDQDDQCCSNKCRGPSGGETCK